MKDKLILIINELLDNGDELSPERFQELRLERWVFILQIRLGESKMQFGERNEPSKQDACLKTSDDWVVFVVSSGPSSIKALKLWRKLSRTQHLKRINVGLTFPLQLPITLLDLAIYLVNRMGSALLLAQLQIITIQHLHVQLMNHQAQQDSMG
jgi:hypothetical protein